MRTTLALAGIRGTPRLDRSLTWISGLRLRHGLASMVASFLGSLLAFVVILAAVTGGGCSRPEVKLGVEFAVVPDGGADAGCAAFSDLACVNYLKFQISTGGGTNISTQCFKVDRRLGTLCDLSSLAKGTELFREDRGEVVEIKVWGLRVFPATSCEVNPECDARILFSGSTDLFRLGDLAGGTVPLRITAASDCGPKEVYRPKGNRDCFVVCDYSAPVCDMSDGCVCLMPESTSLGGRESTWDDAGMWLPADAGVP